MEAVEEQGMEAKQNKADTDDKLMQFGKSLALFDNMMNTPPKQQNELPRQKMPRPSLPPEDNDMAIADESDGESDKSMHSNNTAPKSDDKKKVVAGGN